jgi:CheY-like chemotaxis protein
MDAPPADHGTGPGPTSSMVETLSKKIVGQPHALEFMVPFVQMYQAGLAPEHRPVGIFLLLGPSGTGKTKTVEALAEILHGSESKVLKIDCGEFQMEHEVAKIIGAPPGYLGHRETHPVLTQQRLFDVTSPDCELSIVLFDEIEKAAPSVTQVLLGILDKARLRLGDNTEVNFEKSLIFFTSNLGAREMLKELRPGLGFQRSARATWPELKGKLENIALAAVRKRYSPEFVNRIDAVITYQPLDREAYDLILDHQLAELQRHVNTRLGNRCFNIEIAPATRGFLLERGTSPEYGARELKRTVHRFVTQPLATMVIEGRVEPGSCVRVGIEEGLERLSFEVVPAAPATAEEASGHTIMIVDDNRALLQLLADRFHQTTPWRVESAASVEEARKLIQSAKPSLCLLDVLLPDGNGVRLGAEFRHLVPEMNVILMTGANLSEEEEEICRQLDFEILQKPFLADHVVQMIRMRLEPVSVAARQSRRPL